MLGPDAADGDAAELLVSLLLSLSVLLHAGPDAAHRGGTGRGDGEGVRCHEAWGVMGWGVMGWGGMRAGRGVGRTCTRARVAIMKGFQRRTDGAYNGYNEGYNVAIMKGFQRRTDGAYNGYNEGYNVAIMKGFQRRTDGAYNGYNEGYNVAIMKGFQRRTCTRAVWARPDRRAQSRAACGPGGAPMRGAGTRLHSRRDTAEAHTHTHTHTHIEQTRYCRGTHTHTHT
jgi:hypothetical protein